MIPRLLTFPFRKTRELAPYGGLPLFLRGLVRTVYLRALRRRYGFDPWHTNPIEWRPYALRTCAYVNELVAREGLKSVVEVGCGLGEILGRIRAPETAGFDLSEAVIDWARKMHEGVEFRVGTFDDIRGREIGVLVAVNFPHMIPPEDLRALLAGVLQGNRVRYLVVDEVPYQYHHEYGRILENLAHKVWESEVFVGNRRVLCYRAGATDVSGKG
ncbi:MAG: hypothetical protein NT049_00785 [Planctomycetota bacterium]|nr:hypothetical protein [Planctomycetota bacterium]